MIADLFKNSYALSFNFLQYPIRIFVANTIPKITAIAIRINGANWNANIIVSETIYILIAFSNINVTIESNNIHNIHLSKFLHHTVNKSFNTMFSICCSFFCTSTINISFYITFFLLLYIYWYNKSFIYLRYSHISIIFFYSSPYIF